MTEPRFDHVHPDLRCFLTLSPAERLKLGLRIPFANYPLADRHLKRMCHLATMPPIGRMPCGLIYGPSNNGKSTLIDQFETLIAKQTISLAAEVKQTWVSVLAPPHADEARLCVEILSALHAPLARTSTVREVSTDTRFHLRSAGVQLLIIDEFQHFITGTRTQVRVAMNAIKNLSTALNMSIIGCGLPTAFNAIHSDPQIENRFHPMELPAWNYSDEFKRLLVCLEARLLLREPSNLSSASIAKVIHSRSTGLLGEMTDLLSAACEVVLQDGRECLTVKDLTSANYLGPDERRQLFVTK